MLDRARRAPDPFARIVAIRDLADVLRLRDGDPARLVAAVDALEDAATRDLNEVIRETARHSLSAGASSAAFEAWVRVARPAETEFFNESIQMAERLADGSYANAIASSGDGLEEHALRALRLLNLLESARDRLDDANRILESKATLLRLAERAVLQAQDPSTAREARIALEALRHDC
ncbi:MAG: hypothetical protein FD180_1496 [Planctomycetota bacterium]|nr:MAG: hypothetical protein FD180_1496 [Planctomycetota bacterium]